MTRSSGRTGRVAIAIAIAIAGLLAVGCGRGRNEPPAEVDQATLDAQTRAMNIAVETGAVGDVEALLDAGLPPEAGLVTAGTAGRMDVLELLLERDVEVDGLIGARALFGAVMGEHKEVEELLLASGAHVNGLDDRGRSLLFQSVKWRKASRIRRLLDMGADPSLATHTGRTALMAAVERGHEKIVAMLLRRGADPEACERDGSTALVLGVLARQAGAVGVLLGAGADPNAVSPLGWTALHLAAREGNADMVEILIEAGADPDLSTHTAASPLLQAVKADRRDVVEILLRAGANPRAEFFGVDSSWWAERLARPDLVELIGRHSEARG